MLAQPQVVLLVEDDPNIQEIYATILKSGGYNVTSVVTGDEAIAKIEEHKPEFLLLDLMIPGISGIEVLKKLRTDPKLLALKPQPKVVVVTNVADLNVKAEAQKLGVERYIIKAEISAGDLPNVLKELSATKPAA